MPLLPGCDCCGVCGCIKGEPLPYTFTVTFSGLVNKTHSKHAAINFTSCYGNGVAAVAMAPGGKTEDAGPLTSVLLLEKGSGYAKLGRVEPSLTLVGKGTGATFTPTLAQTAATPGDECPCPTWYIESVAVEGEPLGYLDGDKLTVVLGEGTVQEEPATLTVRAERLQPTLTATVEGGGNGIVLSVTTESNGQTPPTWNVSTVAVDNGGTGYTDGQPVTFTKGEGVIQVSEAAATVVVGREEPTGFAITETYSAEGTGAAVDVQLTQTTNWQGKTVWQVSGGTVQDPGSGYAAGDYLKVQSPSASYEWDGAAWLVVTGVNENGGITSVGVDWSDMFWKSTGAVESVDISSGGGYYKAGDINNIEVEDGGKFYRESVEEPACKAKVKGTMPGCDAEIEGVVDTSPTSPTFGQVTGLTITDPGDNCLAWRWTCTNHEALNGLPIVLRAVNPKELLHVNIEACFGSGANAKIIPNWNRGEPKLKAYAACYPPDYCVNNVGTDLRVDLELTLNQQETEEDGKYWTITGVTVTGSGEGCVDGASVSVIVECGETIEPAQLTQYADADGHITSVAVVNGGKYYRQIDYDGGPTGIKKVTLLSGGSGYAVKGREEPVLTAAVQGKTGATFTPSYTEKVDPCDRPYWEVDSVEVEGGQEYVNASPLTFSPATTNDKIDVPPVAYVYTREEPSEVTATVGGGTGATLSVTLVPLDTTKSKTWKVSAVNVTGGGTGYSNGASVAFSVDGAQGDVQATSAQAHVVVNANGTIVAVELDAAGVYYRDRGIPQNVEVEKGGAAYRENASLPPLVSEVNITISQTPPSNGSGAEFTAVIDQVVSSPTFGQIKKINVTAEGSGYLVYGVSKDCTWEGGCSDGCEVGWPKFTLRMLGFNKPIEVILEDQGATPYHVYAVFRSADLINKDCDDLPTSADLLYGLPSGSVQIARGGLWDTGGEIECQYASRGGCRCDVNPKTQFSWTSDCPCSSGSFGGSGLWGCKATAMGDCKVKSEPDGIEFTAGAMISVECCPIEEATGDVNCYTDPDETCQFEWRPSFSAYVYDAANGCLGYAAGPACEYVDPDGDGPLTEWHGGCYVPCTTDITMDEERCLNGSVTFDAHWWSQCAPPVNGLTPQETCSVTINFTGCQ